MIRRALNTKSNTSIDPKENDIKSPLKDCRYNGTKYSHIVWCGENQEIAQDFASYCYWKTGDFQEIINCGSNELGEVLRKLSDI